MIKIKTADLCSEDYEYFIEAILNEWNKVDQLPACNEIVEIPLPLLAYQDMQLAGGLSFINFQNPERDQMALWINTVYVEEKNRGKGIASKLINEGTRVAKSFGIKELFVYTDKENLYLKNGWQLVSKEAEDSTLKKIL